MKEWFSRARVPAVYALVLVVVSVLSACALVTSFDGTTDVIKSDNDTRSYRYLTLPNQLKVLLISDPASDKAAASLDVHVGSGNDPAEYAGLAHFLEHMLFLGTEKYPQAGEYQAFISAHGGSHNAYTSFEHTNYFFDIDPDYLDPTLDRFAQFFVAPLFNTDYVEREKNAVHSEYMAKLKDDQRRSLDVFKTIVNPQHPFSGFSVGNLDTLSERGKSKSLQQQLLDFHSEYYSANIMTLVVLGNESLAELYRMVEEKFSAIANKGVEIEPITTPLFSDDQHALPKVVSIRPEKNMRLLSLAFPTKEEMPFYHQKPLNYLGNILGHEGKGSLFSYLKSQGWVEQLSAGTGLSFRGGATFNIAIQLTPEGERHVDEIVTAVFQAIERIKATPDQYWLFDEQKQLATQSFRYQEASSPLHYVVGLSTGMHYYQPGDILAGPYVMDSYDDQLIRDFLQDLNPHNVLLTVTTPSVDTNETSHFYQTPYRVEDIPPTQLARWLAAGVDPAIKFPLPNPFIAEQLALKNTQFDDGELAIYRDEKPALIDQGEGFRLWYKPDSNFRTPKASLLVNLKSPVVSRDATAVAMLSMLTELVTDQLNEWSYPAALAGLSYGVAPELQGFSLRISGFDDKQGELLTDILSTLTAADFDSQRFASIQREKVRDLENRVKDQPYRRAIEQLSDLLYNQKPTDTQLLEAYRKLSVQQLMEFREALLASTSLDILVHGNYRKQEARLLSQQIRQALLRSAAAEPDLRVTRLNPGSTFAAPFVSDYSDAAMLLYIQGSDISKQTRAVLGLGAQILRPDFYSLLRTEKQLGYVVTSGAFPVRDIPGVFFLVQSPVASAAMLEDEMRSFLTLKMQDIDELSQQDFERQREALILRISEEPKNLWEQSQKYWSQIDRGYLNFDFDDQLITALRELTLDEWRSRFKQEVSQLDRALWIYTPGTLQNTKPVSGQVIGDVPGWKLAQPVYTFR